MMQTFDQFNETKMDVLREIGNIGAGNAATSLSQMLDTPINLSVPVVRIVDIEETVSAMGGPEVPAVGILAQMTGGISGIMACVIRWEFAQTALDFLLGGETHDFYSLTQMERSAFEEIGNIVISAYACSVATLSQIPINHTVPAMTADMVGAIIGTAAAEMSSVSDKAIYIENEFLGKSKEISANLMLWPALGSLDKLLEGLGIGL